MHSTHTVLLEATNDWYLNIDNSPLNVVLFLDLKEAFDTVNHQVLLEKLKLYGVDAHAFLWFTSYLSDRKQCTYVNGSLSSCLPIICGVPQGSVFGPLLLLIYINDLQACPFSSSVTMYAGDTCFTSSESDPETLQLRLNSDLKIVHTWLQANKLILNVKKTKYLIIASNHRLNQLEHDFDIQVQDQSLLTLNSYRYLGIDVDETVSWQTQVGTIFKKISAGLGALKRVRNLVPRKILLRICEALLLQYIDYCSEVWGCLGKCVYDGLQKLQNRAGRIITC